MLNVIIAMRGFGEMSENKNVLFHIDNKAVVFRLQKGRLRDDFMQSVTRPIWLLAAARDIKLHFKHISGIKQCKSK